MFKSIGKSRGESVTIVFEGRSLVVAKKLNVAAALLESGVTSFRQGEVNLNNRGPYCMMGVCFDCLITIDGLEKQQSCLIQVREGMIISRQNVNVSDDNE
jgi:predicted molibdopterin-dependent oxidoreductase YjgC